LVGRQGPAGPAGPQGPQGERGVEGKQGIRGPVGPQCDCNNNLQFVLMDLAKRLDKLEKGK
jgi:hypothetical protein